MNQNTNNTAAAPFTGGSAGATAKKPRKNPQHKPLDYIAVELTKKQLLFTSRSKPELASIALRLSIYCGTLCNGGKIFNAREIIESPDKDNIIATFAVDAKEAERLLEDASGFWHWKGDTLVVDFYPLMYEHATLEHRRKQSERKKGKTKNRNLASTKATPTHKTPPQNLPDMLADFNNEI